MSTTPPETDAAIKAAIKNEDEDHERLAAVTRRLERERDEAREERDVSALLGALPHGAHDVTEGVGIIRAMRQAITSSWDMLQGIEEHLTGNHGMFVQAAIAKLQPFLILPNPSASSPNPGV